MMDWLKIMMMTRHHRDWHERAFIYVIARKRLVAFVMRAVQELIEYIKKSWQRLNRWKKEQQTRWENSWLGSNFNFLALFVFASLFFWFFCMSPENTVYSFIMDKPLWAFVLLGFLIFLMKGWVARNFDPTSLLVSITLLACLFLMSSEDTEITIHVFIMDRTILVGALLGFPILIKRFDEMRLQSRIAQYNASNELLWSQSLGSRMAGIEGLWRFADDYPKEEYHHVMGVFTQFIKYPIPYEWKDETEDGVGKEGRRRDIGKILQYMIYEKRIAGAKPYDINLKQAHLEGVNLSEAHLERVNLSGAHLKGANLNGAYLEGANLSEARLERANLSEAHLEGVNLSEAHLERANLSEVHLEGVNLSEAHLKGANLNRAYLEGANLFMAHLERADLFMAHLEGANLNGAYLEGANLRQAYLEEADLFMADLEGADLSQAHLEGANLFMAHLERAYLFMAHLEGANLRQAHLEGADLTFAIISGADLIEADLERADLERADLEGADLEGADLTFAIINGANFTNAKNLTQEQIDECVFITDDDFSQDPPTLPEGMEHTYREMEQDEWEEER